MRVIQEIDIIGGKCVRLFQGDYSKETVYSDDPVAFALKWKSLGATKLHIVDLDGAGGRERKQVQKGVSVPFNSQLSRRP